MDRLTIPDVKLDEHTTRRTMIDGEAVRERAMEIYWRLKDYEDTGLTPAEVLSISGEWCAMMSVLNSIGGYDRLRELAEADKEGRVVVLPCKVGGSMLDMSYPEKPSIMKRFHFAVAYENIDGVVYHQPWGIFTENIKAGYIKPISSEEKRND